MVRLSMLHLFVSSICMQPTIENYTDNWNEHDAYVFQNAVKECSKSRILETCMNRFRKVDENVYSFTCKAPQ